MQIPSQVSLLEYYYQTVSHFSLIYLHLGYPAVKKGFQEQQTVLFTGVVSLQDGSLMIFLS